MFARSGDLGFSNALGKSELAAPGDGRTPAQVSLAVVPARSAPKAPTAYLDKVASTASACFPTKYTGDSSSTESFSERLFPMMS